MTGGKAELHLTTATEHVRPGFRRNRLLQGLVVAYAAFWVWMAVSPLSRHDWLLENILVLVSVGTLVITYRWFALSDLSYVLIFVFLLLHGVGAHYTYAKVPFGFWLQDALELSRNHFDRIVHFAFGLLLAYPIREVFLRIVRTRGFWAYYLPLDVTLAFSALFEVIESWVARLVNPELGDEYLGTQGDIWDAQKDITAALIGGILCMVVTAIVRRWFDKGERVKSPY